MTHVSLSTQLLSLRLSRSVFSGGWYAVVRCVTAFQSSDMNCDPRSKEGLDGVLNRETHVAMNTRAASVDVADDSGTASSQRMVLSTIVRKGE